MGCICNLGSGPEEKGGLESRLTSGGALFCKKLDILPLLLLFLPTTRPAIKLNHLETWALTCVGVYTK